MFDPDADAPPINPLPPVVIVLVLMIGAVEGVLQLAEAGVIGAPGGAGWRLEWGRQYGAFN